MADSGILTGVDAGCRHEVDLAGAARTVWRRKWLLCAIVTGITLSTAIVSSSLTRLYSAEALVSVEPHGKLLQLARGSEPQLSDITFVDTQTQVLMSPALAEKVIADLRLQNDPEFNTALEPPTGLAAWWAPKELPSAASTRAAVLSRFLSRLSVTPRGTSYIISVDFVSRSPEKAARIANAVADAYLQSQISAKRQAMVHAVDWLKTRLGDLRRGLVSAESAVEAYRSEKGLTTGTLGPVAQQQITEFNQQLVSAEADYARAKAKFDATQHTLSGASSLEQAPDVISNPTIQALRAQEARLITALASLSEILGDQNPRVVEAKAQLRDLRAAIQAEAGKIVKGLARDVDAASARVRSLQVMVDRIRGENATLSQAAVHLRELEREADARRQSYMSLLARQEEILAQESFQVADAQIIGPALIPAHPSFPRTKLAIGGAVIVSTLLGALVILLLESRSRGVLSREQIEWNLGLPVLSILPRLQKGMGRSLPSIATALERSSPLGEEAIRALIGATAVLPRRDAQNMRSLPAPRQGKVILVTSALPCEGKTVLSATMARKAAQAGRKCLLVDCDFRRHGLEKLLDQRGKPGILQMLMEEAQLDDVILHVDGCGVDFIPSGAAVDEGDAARRCRIKDQLPFLLGAPF